MFDRIGSNLIQASLSAQSVRQRVIAENIANVNTPGYMAKTVQFEEFLQKSAQRPLSTTNERHISLSGSRLEPKVETSENPVEIDTEMSEMAKLQLLYSLESQSLSRRYRMLREAISGQIR
jgi:flagellar basal-body rod protein FlgB